ELSGPYFFAFYLLGRRETVGQPWLDQLLDSWADNNRDLAQTVLEATWRGLPSEHGARRVLALIERDWIPVTSLGFFSVGGWANAVSSETFRAIAERLIRTRAAIDQLVLMLRTRLQGRPHEESVLADIAWQVFEIALPSPGARHSSAAYH